MGHRRVNASLIDVDDPAPSQTLIVVQDRYRRLMYFIRPRPKARAITRSKNGRNTQRLARQIQLGCWKSFDDGRS